MANWEGNMMEEQYCEKYCVCCGKKFCGLNNDEPVNKICQKCSYKLMSDVKPKITRKRRIAEFILFILINALMFKFFSSELKKFSSQNISRNNLLTLAVLSVLILGTFIIIFITIKNKKK